MNEATCRCPFCDSPDVETVAAWGGQLMTRQMRCRACNSHFEAVRDEFDSDTDEHA
jgi:formate dehydrogenase maturation protein FdhE